MLGFRISSPCAWVGALILFFLPWIDVRCTNRGDRSTVRITGSGAQMAWGGGTIEHAGQPTTTSLGDASIWEKPHRAAAGVLLSLYFAGLAIGVVFAVACPPTISRAEVGGLLALVLLGLLLAGSWVLLRDAGGPFLPAGPPTAEGGVRYTNWYYGSYLVNLVALASFGLEYWATRRRRRLAELEWPLRTAQPPESAAKPAPDERFCKRDGFGAADDGP